MKTLAAALTHVLFALVLASSGACSTPKVASKAPTAQAEERAALVKALNALTAQGPLYFETDTDVLTDSSQVLLQRIAAMMHRVPKVRVVVSGHADQRGDTAYNLALGEKRGHAARDYMLRLGIPKQRIHIVSLGEEQPAVLASATQAEAWALDRRDEFAFILPGENRSALHLGVEESASDLLASSHFAQQK